MRHVQSLASDSVARDVATTCLNCSIARDFDGELFRGRRRLPADGASTTARCRDADRRTRRPADTARAVPTTHSCDSRAVLRAQASVAPSAADSSMNSRRFMSDPRPRAGVTSRASIARRIVTAKVWTRTMTQPLADIGLIGLAVMGENFALNMESKGFRVAVYNRTVDARRRVHRRPRARQALHRRTHACRSWSRRCKRPRKILMLGQGRAARSMRVIDQLLPLLERGDILIDGGNSLFTDTIASHAQGRAAPACCTSARACPAARRAR